MKYNFLFIRINTNITMLAVILCALTMLSSCIKEEVFKPDKKDKRLPKYTEKGNQVGGALINNTAWKTNYGAALLNQDDAFFIINSQSGDSVVFRLEGRFNEGEFAGRNINLQFVIRNSQVDSWKQIGKLNNMRFTLDGTNSYAIIEDDSQTFEKDVAMYVYGNGELYIKRVQEKTKTILGSGPAAYHPAILSGTFHFQILHNGNVINVENGRFDFWFYNSNLELR